MIVETLLLLISTVALAMALAMLPAIWSREGDRTGVRYWAWGCVALGWSWLARGWGPALPLESAAMLIDGLRVLGITLLAQGSCSARVDGPATLNPLWPIGLLLAGHLAAVLFPWFWPARGLFAAGIVAWAAWRTGFPLLRDRAGPRGFMGAGFLVFGLLAVSIAYYRHLFDLRAAIDEHLEVIAAMLELTVLVFLTTSFLVARPRRARIAPRPPTRDAVTGCLDRAEIDRRLERAFAGRYAQDEPLQEPLSVLMIDLDHLKAINDNHGHPAGDDALRAVATALARQVRAGDSVGRYGGDEFLAILPRTTASEADHVVDRMRAALAQLEGRDEPLTVSVGVAQRHAGDRPETLIARADAALYTAKREGRNRVVTIGNVPPTA